jgi:hypothetical protein
VLRLLAVSAPTLWRAEAFLIDGSPTPLPARCDVLFAVLIADERDLGIVYFASSKIGGIPLISCLRLFRANFLLLKRLPTRCRTGQAD